MSDYLYVSTTESSNYARLCRLLLDIGTDVFRYVFDKLVPPPNLAKFLANHEKKLKKKPSLRGYQKKTLFPDQEDPSSENFDISLLYLLFREACDIEAPINGWGNPVDPSDNGIGANIERIRQARNEIYGHVQRAWMNECAFEENWLVLSKALIHLGGNHYEQVIDKLRYASLDPESDKDYLRRLSDWISEGSRRLDSIEDTVSKIRDLLASMAKGSNEKREQLIRIIEFRTKEDQCFIETRAYSDIEEKLSRGGSVLIVGDPGEGKTASAWHVILKCLVQGFELHVVDSPQAWQSKWTPKTKQIFLVDDCFGKSQMVPKKIEAWLTLQDQLGGCIDSAYTYIVSTLRRTIYRDCRDLITRLTLFGIAIDINDLSNSMTPNERLTILRRHMKQDVDADIEHLIKSEQTPRFPLSCRLFASEERFRKQGTVFFKNPVSQLRDEIVVLAETNNMAFSALVLLLLADGNLDSRLLVGEQTTESKPPTGFIEWIKLICCTSSTTVPWITEAIESIKLVRKLPKGTRSEDFRINLERLLKIYVIYDNGRYTFVHESVSEAVGVVLAIGDIEFVLKKASPNFIQQRVIVDSTSLYGLVRNTSVVLVPDIFYRTLAERLTDDVLDGHLDTTFQNQSLSEIGFIACWCTYLSTLPRSKYLQFMRRIDDRGFSVQYWAAMSGNDVLLKYFLEYQDPTSDALHGACCGGSFECVKMVLGRGVDTNITDSSGFTPLLIACNSNNHDILRLLISYGADVNLEQDDFGTALHYACWNKDQNLVSILLDNGAKSNVVTTAGWPNVVFDGEGTNIMTLLMNREKTLHLTSNTNWSALHLACGKDNIEIVNLLLQYGADINQCTTQGWSPLLCATKKGLHLIVNILIQKGADVNIKDHFGVTCLHRVCYDGYLYVARALLRGGADVNAQSKALYTPLHCACENGHVHLVHLLLENGADPNISSMSKKTSLDIALKKKRYDIVSILEKL